MTELFPPLHFGALHPFELLLVVLIALAPFIVMLVVVVRVRNRDAEEDEVEGRADDLAGPRTGEPSR